MVRALDDAWLLLLASRSEGTPRVVLEALCRGRAVVGARAGGIPDVVSDDETRAARRPGPARGDRRRARPDPLRPRARGASRRRRARALRRVDVHRGRVRRPCRRARRERRRGEASMRKLIVVTQQVDPASAVLGATVPKLRALAERVDELVVLTDSAAEGALPDNVAIRTFSASRRARRGMRFESALARELSRRPRPSAVLAHMCPIYAVLAAPLARPTGVKVLLWFTHWRRSALLSTATRASSKVLSVDERTFPLQTRKLVAIGHGIDVSDLPCVKRPRGPRAVHAPRARPHVGGEGARHDHPRGRAGARGATPHRRAVRHRRGADPPDRARAARHRPRPARPRRHQRPGAAAGRSRRSTPTSTRSSTTCAKAPRTRSSTKRPRRASR